MNRNKQNMISRNPEHNHGNAPEIHLKKGESWTIDTVNWDSLDETEQDPRVLATITIPGSKIFQLIDLRNAKKTGEINGISIIDWQGLKLNKTPNIPFILVGSSDTGKKTAMGIRLDNGGYTVVGRGVEKSAKRFGLTSPDISRQHFSVAIGDDSLVVTNNSANGTKVTPYNRPSSNEIGLGFAELSQARAELSLEKFSPQTQKLTTPLTTDSLGQPAVSHNESPRRESFDDLWNVSDEEARERAHRYIDEVNQHRPNKRNSVNDENIRSARDMLTKAVNGDGELGNIIKEYAKSSEIIDELRTNHALRCAVFDYFRYKLERIRELNSSILPERVRRDDPNNLKSPNSDGYPVDKMLSSEYASVLALAMVDGSFDASRADTTQSHIRSDGSPGMGQHRDAARTILLTKK